MSEFENLLGETRAKLIALVFKTIKNCEDTSGSKKRQLEREIFFDMVGAVVAHGFVSRARLSHLTGYEKSQIGRWVLKKACPPKGTRLMIAKVALVELAPEMSSYF